MLVGLSGCKKSSSRATAPFYWENPENFHNYQCNPSETQNGNNSTGTFSGARVQDETQNNSDEGANAANSQLISDDQNAFAISKLSKLSQQVTEDVKQSCEGDTSVTPLCQKTEVHATSNLAVTKKSQNKSKVSSNEAPQDKTVKRARKINCNDDVLFVKRKLQKSRGEIVLQNDSNQHNSRLNKSSEDTDGGRRRSEEILQRSFNKMDIEYEADDVNMYAESNANEMDVENEADDVNTCVESNLNEMGVQIVADIVNMHAESNSNEMDTEYEADNVNMCAEFNSNETGVQIVADIVNTHAKSNSNEMGVENEADDVNMHAEFNSDEMNVESKVDDVNMCAESNFDEMSVESEADVVNRDFELLIREFSRLHL